MVNNSNDKMIVLMIENEEIINKVKSISYLEICDLSLQNNVDSYISESVTEDLVDKLTRNNVRDIQDAYSAFNISSRFVYDYPINPAYNFNESYINTVILDNEYIGDIRPEYLFDYVNKSKYIIDDITKKREYSSKQLADKFASKEEINKIKGQLVKNSSGFINDKNTGMRIMDKATIVTNDFVTNVINPYINDINSTVKIISSNVEKTIFAINENYKQITRMNTTVNNMILSKTIDKDMAFKVKKAMNKIILGYMQLINHMSIMMIYKLTYHIYILNAIQYISKVSNSKIEVLESAVSDISKLTPEFISSELLKGNMDIFESAIDSIFESYISISDPEINKIITDRDLNLLIPHIDEVLNRYEAIYKPKAKKYTSDIDVTIMPFKDDYLKISEVSKSLSHKITAFVELLETRTYSIEEAMERVKMNDSVAAEYGPYIENLRSCDSYNKADVQLDQNKMEYMVLSEFKKFDTLITPIIGNLDDVNKSIMTALEIFSNVTEGAVLIEITEIFQGMKNEIDKVISSIGLAIVERIGMLEKYLIPEIENVNISTEVTEAANYYEDAIELFIHADKYDNEEIVADITNMYTKLKTQMESAIEIIYEADTTSDEEKFSLVEWIKSLLAKWRLKINKIISNYNPWIMENKDAIAALNVDSMNVDIMPYFKISNDRILSMITSDINNTIGNVRSIDKNQLQTYTSESLRAKMFGHIPLDTIPVTDDNVPITSKLRQYYSFGTNKPVKVSLSGSALKKEIGYMITFCEMYSKNVNTLENSFNALSSSVDGKCKELRNNEKRKEVASTNSAKVTSTPVGAPQVAESNVTMLDRYLSLFVEAEEAPNVTKKNIVKSATVLPGGKPIKVTKLPSTMIIKNIERDVTTLVTSTMTAYEARYYAYLSTLKGLMNASKGSEEK